MSGPLQKEKHLEQLGFGPGPEQAEQTAPLQQQGGINGPQEIREHLQQLEKWDDEKMYAAKAIVEKIDGKYVRTNKTKVDKTRSQLLSEFGARMLEEFGNRQQILIPRVRHEGPRAEAEAAVPEEPVQDLLPAEKSDKKVEEELKQTKAARKHNDYADYTSFNLNKQITTYYKERNNALKGKWRDGINDENQRAMYAFLQGHASGLFAKNAERDAADRAFIEDYTSGELERRRPYLDQAVNEILNFRLNEELFTTEYMGAHGMELIAMNEKMKSFKIMRDDPINRDYFHQLPEEQLTMLTYAMDWYPQRLADMVPAILAVKGLGGIHLACNAMDQEAVNRLRMRKRRAEKPLALMCRSLEAVRRICRVTDGEEKVLTSPARPIVLLAKKDRDALHDHPARHSESKL